MFRHTLMPAWAAFLQTALGCNRAGEAGADAGEGDDAEEPEQDAAARQATLLALTKGEAVALVSITPEQHFTQPPGRFTEASLVRELERLGIGRPSTYASILKVLQARAPLHASITGPHGVSLPF